MGDNQDLFDSPFGLTLALIERRKAKKAMQQINRNNILNQGIIRYQKTQIENFFDDTKPIGNIILSGGDEIVRFRALVRGMGCAYRQGYIPVVLHASNFGLENHLVSELGNASVSYLNAQFPYYEPFIGLSDSEICHMIMNSVTKKYNIQGMGKYYIDGISNFIRSRGTNPYLWMYVTCPHMELTDKINNCVAKGMFTDAVARNILSQIVQGELERGNIENFFAELNNEANYIMAKKSDLNRAVNINKVVTERNIFVMDIRNSANVLLINILMNEIEMLINQGKKIFLCLDGVRVAENEFVAKLIKTHGNQISICVMGQDVYSDFSGDDSLFYSFVGKATKIVLSKHISAYSCQKLSEIFGHYDKQEVSNTYTSNVNMIGKFSYGTSVTDNISIRRENIVKPEEIARLNDNEVYILDRNTNEIAHTYII